jgi:hypothetical protein
LPPKKSESSALDITSAKTVIRRNLNDRAQPQPKPRMRPPLRPPRRPEGCRNESTEWKPLPAPLAMRRGRWRVSTNSFLAPRSRTIDLDANTKIATSHGISGLFIGGAPTLVLPPL